MQAIGKYLIICPVYEEKKNKIILSTTKEKVTCWLVISCGEEVENIRQDDQIFITAFAERPIDEENKIYAVHVDQIMGRK